MCLHIHWCLSRLCISVGWVVPTPEKNEMGKSVFEAKPITHSAAAGENIFSVFCGGTRAVFFLSESTSNLDYFRNSRKISILSFTLIQNFALPIISKQPRVNAPFSSFVSFLQNCELKSAQIVDILKEEGNHVHNWMRAHSMPRTDEITKYKE